MGALAAPMKPVHALRAKEDPTLIRLMPISAKSDTRKPTLEPMRMLTGGSRTCPDILSNLLRLICITRLKIGIHGQICGSHDLRDVSQHLISAHGPICIRQPS
jgi:hypothetical protein